VPVFVDTNVFLYALDTGDLGKQRAAQLWRSEMWQSQRGRTSFQVLGEFYAIVIKKWPNVQDQARAEIRDLLSWQPVKIDGPIMEHAWKVQDRYKFSFWDSLIVASAKAASCRYLLTEDMQSNQMVEGIRVVNPFLAAPDSLKN
jgi:predicted nucleic acid-binding protein